MFSITRSLTLEARIRTMITRRYRRIVVEYHVRVTPLDAFLFAPIWGSVSIRPLTIKITKLNSTGIDLIISGAIEFDFPS